MYMIFPWHNYGQGAGNAWAPSRSAPVYSMVERARHQPAFALVFCMDILFGKERSGDYCYQWEFIYDEHEENGEIIRTNKRLARVRKKTKNSDGKYGWLYNQNSLNASKSGVPAIFGPPAAKRNGAWRFAVPCTRYKLPRSQGSELGPKPDGAGDFTFVIEDPITDARYTSMLNAGHCAFSAADSYGTKVCVPWGRNDGAQTAYVPRKHRRGRPEAGNSKKTPVNRYYQ